MQTIGEKIKVLRKSKKITQEELSYELGVSRQTVHKWERNEARPGTDNIKSLCVFFKVSSDYFINESAKVGENVVADGTTTIEETATVDATAKVEEVAEGSINNAVKDAAVIDNRQNQKTKIYLIVSAIVIIIISLVLIGSIFFTIGTGCIVFTNNIGKEYLSVLEVHSYSFYLFLIMSIILFTLDLIVIFIIKKVKSKA